MVVSEFLDSFLQVHSPFSPASLAFINHAETTTKHSITTTTKHSTTKTAKSGVVTGLKGIFRGCNMYTYMYCMYRIGGIIAAAYSYERRLYAQYVRRPASSLFCGFMDRPEYLGDMYVIFTCFQSFSLCFTASKRQLL